MDREKRFWRQDESRRALIVVYRWVRYLEKHSVILYPRNMISAAKTVAIEKLIEELRRLPESAFDQTEPLRRFLQETPVNADSLASYLNWDRQHYTRNLIDRTPLYELMAICWEVGQASSLHNHREQNCWMAVPMGRLRVENFHLVHQDLRAGQCCLEPKDTVEMNISHPCAVDPADPVHRVVNPREFNQRAVSLHVYSRPFDTCVVYSPEQGTCGEIQLHFNTMFGKTAG
jgi:predicted metal-dependent enzyme (double-stranded beta helix superfamily)